MINPPNNDIVRAFGGNRKPRLLVGGEGESYRVNDIVFKPVQDGTQTQWNAEVLSSIKESGFRVSKPVKTVDGKWIFNNWQAFVFLPGKEKAGCWRSKIRISRIFHEALLGIERPNFIGKRNIPWEIADKAVWEDDSEHFSLEICDITNQLTAIKRQIEMSEQLIHGDMTGNILFHKSLAPAVIDFSPYWKPKEYATAIILVDAIVWEGADDNLLVELRNTFENNQLLIRAVLWRIKTAEIFRKMNNSNPVEEVKKYQHFIELILERVAKEEP